MELDFAILADAVSVREGLVFILGGGLDTVNAPGPGYPSSIALAIRLLAGKQHAQQSHKLEVRFLDQDGNLLPELPLPAFDIPANPNIEPHPVPGWKYPLTFPVAIHGVPFQRAGVFAIEILIDGHSLKQIPFRVQFQPMQKSA